MHKIMASQVGAQGAPCERAGAGTAGDALTSFLQKQLPTEPEIWGPLCHLPQGQLGTQDGCLEQG